MQIRRLVRFRKRYARQCWVPLEPPQKRADVDDPLLALMGKLCCRCLPPLSRERPSSRSEPITLQLELSTSNARLQVLGDGSLGVPWSYAALLTS